MSNKKQDEQPKPLAELSCIQIWCIVTEEKIHRYMINSRKMVKESLRAELEHKAAAIYEALTLMAGINKLDHTDKQYLQVTINRINTAHGFEE